MKKRLHPKAVGDATEAMVLARLVQAYPEAEILKPFGENSRYDLAIDTGEKFIRVQCKTGRMRSGAVYFPASSTTFHNSRPGGARPYIRDYRGSADLFGVYCRELDKVYLIPVESVGKSRGAVRVESPKNNQQRRIRWASDFELRAGLAHLVEQRFCKPQAVGSSPTPGSDQPELPFPGS